jgi:dipeptidyl aminopeptidase/acylaminoacyl peptidase
MIAITVLWIAGAIALFPLLNLGLGVHPPTFKTEDDPSRYGLPYERVAFQTADGLTLHGWFIPSASPEGSSREPGAVGCRATIVVGHGYPFDKANILSHSLFLHDRFNLLLIDFRYFGESEGLYTTAGLLETRDVEASVAYLKERADVDPQRIGAMGFSMSAAAFILARHPDIRAIVADSSYASLEDLVGRQFFFLPGPTKWPLVALTKLYARLLLGVEVEAAAPARTVRELTAPLLIIHGEVDSQIPVEHARQIYANADPARTELWIVPGADHGQAHAIEGPRYEIRVRTFLERNLCGAAA